MKNTIKTFVIMGALLQGTATFAQVKPYLILDINVPAAAAAYTVKSVSGNCNVPIGKELQPGPVRCVFLKKEQYNNFNIKLTESMFKKTCDLAGSDQMNGNNPVLDNSGCLSAAPVVVQDPTAQHKINISLPAGGA